MTRNSGPDGAAESRYHLKVLTITVLEDEMQVLLIAFCTIAAIWLIVLWGSRYLGPQ
jgi:hypothetical protein